MIHEDVERRYGPYLAEMIRQALTLEEFGRLDVDELAHYFALRAARTYQEYIQHENVPMPDPRDGRILSADHYQAILRRRWQAAEEIAQRIIQIDRDAVDDLGMMVG